MSRDIAGEVDKIMAQIDAEINNQKDLIKRILTNLIRHQEHLDNQIDYLKDQLLNSNIYE